jgi:hypothetical protein
MKLHIAALAALLALAGCQSVPSGPSLIAYNQYMRYTGAINISRVFSNGPGWIVVYDSERGAPGRILGTARVPGGVRYDMRVFIEAGRATDTLFVKLHADRGTEGVFECPGPDEPVVVDGSEVMTSFRFYQTLRKMM